MSAGSSDTSLSIWALNGLMGLIAVLLGLGVKDLRERLRGAELAVIKIESLETTIKVQEAKIKRLEDKLDRILYAAKS